MPKSIYDSLDLWGLSKCGIPLILADNSIKNPLGIAVAIYTRFSRKVIPIDYYVIECEGEGQIIVGRTFLRLVGAVIHMREGIVRFNSIIKSSHTFPTNTSKGNKSKGKQFGLAHLDNT